MSFTGYCKIVDWKCGLCSISPFCNLKFLGDVQNFFFFLKICGPLDNGISKAITLYLQEVRYDKCGVRKIAKNLVGRDVTAGLNPQV